MHMYSCLRDLNYIQAADMHLSFIFFFKLAVYKLLVAVTTLTFCSHCGPHLHRTVGIHTHTCALRQQRIQTHTHYELQITPNRLSKELFNTRPRFENQQAGIVSHLFLTVCLFLTLLNSHAALSLSATLHTYTFMPVIEYTMSLIQYFSLKGVWIQWFFDCPFICSRTVQAGVSPKYTWLSIWKL